MRTSSVLKMNSCQIIPGFIILGTLLLLIGVAKPWVSPKDNFQRWVRSLLAGISTTIIVISGLALVSLNQSTGYCLRDVQNLRISSWACFGIPVFIITTIGNYVGYGQIIWLNSIRKRIDRRKR